VYLAGVLMKPCANTISGNGLAASATLAAVAGAALGAGNGRQIIPYTCVSGPLAGQTVNVSNAPGDANGVAGFVDGSVYLARSITVTIPGVGVVYQKTYGETNGAGAPSDCIAQEGPQRSTLSRSLSDKQPRRPQLSWGRLIRAVPQPVATSHLSSRTTASIAALVRAAILAPRRPKPSPTAW
jgi:hypothetical protein